MADVIWTEPALQELDAIDEYIALDNPAAVSHLVREVFDKIEGLDDFPQSGRVPPELPNSVYREVVVHHVAFFIVKMGVGFLLSISCERSSSFARTCLGASS
ncbi:type II toxin-antitoxin system RelE/ParE family toxin [Halomonas sp. AOP13-D3-9]